MPSELRENSGSLFKNDHREKDTSPEYTGSINVGGTLYALNAWLKEGSRGKFFSLSVREKAAEQSHPAKSANRPRF